MVYYKANRVGVPGEWGSVVGCRDIAGSTDAKILQWQWFMSKAGARQVTGQVIQEWELREQMC